MDGEKNCSGCGEKHKHKTEDAAYAQYRQIVESRNLTSDTLSVYECLVCNFWVVGHQRKEI